MKKWTSGGTTSPVVADAYGAFTWSAHLATGNDDVDREHRELFELFNTISRVKDGGDGRSELTRLIGETTRYALRHFAHEEALMESAGIDHRHFDMHRKVHGEFAARLRSLPVDAHDPAAAFNLLARWLSIHILGVDQTMVRQLSDISAGVAAAEAFTLANSDASDPAMNALLDALSSQRQQAEDRQVALRQLLAQVVDNDPVPTLVIDAEHRVTHWNRACAAITGVSAAEMVGSHRQWAAFYEEERPIMADLILDGALEAGVEKHYGRHYRRSPLIDGAFEAESFFPKFGDGGVWLYFTAAPLRDAHGRVVGAIETLQDVTERHRAEEALRAHQATLEATIAARTADLARTNVNMAAELVRRECAEAELLRGNAELSALNRKLSQAQEQLLQSEKLAAIGQLAAGVAHEINNPIGYVYSNIGSLENYLNDLFLLLKAYEEAEADLPEGQRRAALQSLREKIDVDFLKEDIPMLMGESKEGITRVKKIVQDLKEFSHVDHRAEWQWTNVRAGLDSTLNIANNEIKYKADVVRDYGQLPEIECLPSELNQVFMNLVVNAAHAIGDTRGTITVRTRTDGEEVWIEVSDTGCGISDELRQKIFDPFFTTKPVGKGTGLGLSLSYGIVQKHHGRIEVYSELGKGSTFRIRLPVRQPTDDGGANAATGEKAASG